MVMAHGGAPHDMEPILTGDELESTGLQATIPKLGGQLDVAHSLGPMAWAGVSTDG